MEGQTHMLNYNRANDAEQKTSYAHNAIAVIGAITIVACVLVTLIIITLLITTGHDPTKTLLAGIGFFIAAVISSQIILTDTLKEIAIAAIQHKTALGLADRQQPAPRIIDVTPTRALPEGGPRTPRALLPDNRNFVPPRSEQEEEVRSQAAAWVRNLYGADGQPDPKKVNLAKDSRKQGTVWVKWPDEQARHYLANQGIILDYGNSIALRLPHYATLDALEEKLSP